MSYYKTTTITGYNTAEINPYSAQALGRFLTNEEYGLCARWNDEHYKITVRPGHWKPASVLSYAQRCGLERVEMSHNIHDLSGHGRGHRRDFRFDGSTFVEVGAADVDDADDIHDAYDAVEAR